VAFATAAELASYLQITEIDTFTAELLLDAASAAIRSVTGQTVDAVTDDVVLLPAPRGAYLTLPQRPADEPTLIRIGGVAVTDWSADVSDDPRYPTVLYRPGGWESWDTVTGAVRRVEVTYTHGYAVIPDDIKALCLEVAARGYRNPAGLRSQQRAVDDYSETDTYATETVGAVGLTPSEARTARRALGVPSAVSVPLR
jgi:hypothetical protein